jgi:hypothetical protein
MSETTTFTDDQCDVDKGGKIFGAFSTSHSMVSALPAISANSAPGLRGRISVAAVGCELQGNMHANGATRTSKDDTKIARRHKVGLVVFLNPASVKSHTRQRGFTRTTL